MSTNTDREPLRTAVVYDFDGTLAPGNIQEHSLLPDYLGVAKDAFWEEVYSRRRAGDADQILVYMHLLLEHAKARNLPITAEVLRQHAKNVPFFEGVKSWFERIDHHAEARGLALEHYVISSGNEEMIRGTSIAAAFRHIFGCRYEYDSEGHAVWPAVAINYTTKTQFLFRINKGVLNNWDDDAVNRWQPMNERSIPFARMVFLGDGDTDIPAMKMVRHQGGHSVAVFDPAKWSKEEMQRKVYNLIAEDRAGFVVPADYTTGSQLDITVKGILGRIARDEAGYRGGA
ncbi:MAG: haloacid dehalogenase-like hydrolase [Deltaproteobacteria bacterium]|nr:MAG: haloacid dehalogenase-like hydrolase [Deltaproteobacteria bacterium]